MRPRLTCPRCHFASTRGPPLVLPVPSRPRPCVAIARPHTSGACVAVSHRRHAASCLCHVPLPRASAARHVPLPRTAPRAPSRSPLNPLVLTVALAHSPPRAFAPPGWPFAILGVLARAVSRSALVLALRPHTLAYPSTLLEPPAPFCTCALPCRIHRVTPPSPCRTSRAVILAAPPSLSWMLTVREPSFHPALPFATPAPCRGPRVLATAPCTSGVWLPLRHPPSWRSCTPPTSLAPLRWRLGHLTPHRRALRPSEGASAVWRLTDASNL
ncbi:hypothetical protein DENSPDRAFT_128319 [Dentipellis sp. KUC8613]|nr:hypothetical protein DENSPDRAFT_128319 [Dentipellis sp. KUC8613]